MPKPIHIRLYNLRLRVVLIVLCTRMVRSFVIMHSHNGLHNDMYCEAPHTVIINRRQKKKTIINTCTTATTNQRPLN